VTTPSSETPAPPRYRLRTFGTLRLVGSADDTVLGDHGHQRRRLALLAVLAASGEHGRSRDQLLGLFWPEVSQSRARHSLEQLLYAIRESLGESVFAGVNPLRLNAAFLDSDIGRFADALARGELETAVELYRGPFLEGFYLSDAPEFEQWMDAERGRIERSYTDALERLAKRAEDANDSAAAARWRQKLIETDPVSSKHAIGLIRALVNAGDHAAALRYAERYEAIVGQELGTSVGPAVAGLVAEVRARAKTESVVVRGATQPTQLQRAGGSSLPAAHDHAPTEPSDAVTHQAQPLTTQISARRRRAAALYGILALALATLVVAAWWLRPRVTARPAHATAEPSVALLPLKNVSGDPRDAALVDGLSEELMGVVAKIHHLRVVAPTSAFVFKNSDLDERRIADSLGVSNILEGSVQKAGQRIRVQVRLVDARDGSTRWAGTYNRELKDIFLVQSDIAAAVARELDLRLGGGAAAALRRAPTQNIAAYELYLRGNDPTLLRSDSGMRLGVEYFRQAIALDSTYAAAYAGLARMDLVLLLGQRAGTSAHELAALAEKAALKAVALDDSSAEAHATVGLLLMLRYDFAAAEKELTRAAAIDAGQSRTPRTLVNLSYWKERPADALVEANRLVDNDPLSPSAHAEVARALCANRDYREGLARLKRLEAVRPPLLRLPAYEGLCHAMQRDWPAAVAALRQARGNRGRGLLGYALARAGQRQQALAVLADVMNHSERTNQGAFEVAAVHAGLGNRDQAFEWLNRSIDDLSLSENIMLPLFDDLHADPRFERLRRRLGLQNP
jgi:TolB-like protein/DNA-binding SARP family transcriptional activator